MKMQIRSSVFETNSSSSHSITLSKSETIDFDISKSKLSSGEICIHLGDFSTNWFRYRSFENKLNYLICSMCSDILFSHREGMNCTSALKDNFEASSLIELVEEVTGCDVILYAPSDWGLETFLSYGKYNNLDQISLGEKGNVKQFLFDRNSFIEVENDNYELGEHISNDLVGREPFKPEKITDKAPDEATFELSFNAVKKDIGFSDGIYDITVPIDYLQTQELQAVLDGAVITEANVEFAPSAELRDNQCVRDAFFKAIDFCNQRGPNFAVGLRVMNDLDVTSENRLPDGFENTSLYTEDCHVTIKCASTKEVLDRISDKILEIASMKNRLSL